MAFKIGARMEDEELRRTYCPLMREEEYQHFKGQFNSWLKDPLTVPFLVWDDGGSPYNGSPEHVWALTMMNLAMDPKKRREPDNIVLSTIMWGEEKPKDLDIFTSPLSAELHLARPYQLNCEQRLLLPLPICFPSFCHSF